MPTTRKRDARGEATGSAYIPTHSRPSCERRAGNADRRSEKQGLFPQNSRTKPVGHASGIAARRAADLVRHHDIDHDHRDCDDHVLNAMTYAA
jgi:hypothetical protein